MTRIRVELCYNTYGQVFVNLPEGMEVDDIDDLYVKWADGGITFTDGTTMTFDAECDDWEHDFKRPDSIDYYEDNDEY